MDRAGWSSAAQSGVARDGGGTLRHNCTPGRTPSHTAGAMRALPWCCCGGRGVLRAWLRLRGRRHAPRVLRSGDGLRGVRALDGARPRGRGHRCLHRCLEFGRRRGGPAPRRRARLYIPHMSCGQMARMEPYGHNRQISHIIHCQHVVSGTAYFLTRAPTQPRPRSGPTQMRAVRLSTAVGPHVGRFKGVLWASKSGSGADLIAFGTDLSAVSQAFLTKPPYSAPRAVPRP